MRPSAVVKTKQVRGDKNKFKHALVKRTSQQTEARNKHFIMQILISHRCKEVNGEILYTACKLSEKR